MPGEMPLIKVFILTGGRDEGAFVAISKLGKGKAAFVGDSSTVEDKTPVYVREESGAAKTTYDGFKEQDDSILLTNLINWLATQEDYTDFEDQGITLDEESPLLDMEAPEKSTEPETEPWSNPPSGYKWYDRTTFRPGSYGSGEMSVNPTYDVVHQDTLPGEMQTFAIRITGEKLSPFASESDFRLGLYLDGGMQAGQFSLDGENWQSDFGYSDYFNLTADSDGNAEKDIYVRIKNGISGDAHLRLKQGSSNVFTKDVTIDPNAKPEPLPDGNAPTIPAPTNLDQVRTMGENQQVTAQGIVVSEPGLFGAQGFYMQDETGGIYVYQSTEGIHAGDVVSVTGKLAKHNSELEITNPNIIKIDTADIPKPKVVEQLSEKNQGELVQLNDVTVKNIHQAAGNAFEFDVTKGKYTTSVRIDSRTGIDLDKFPYQEGDVIDIAGISAVFNGVYQLKPRQWQDLHHTFKIKEARALGVDQQVTVEGVVTTKTGLWGAKAFYIQDVTGGIYVFTSKDFNVKPGDVVKISATTTTHDGEFELNDITSLEKTSTGELPKAQFASPSNLKDHLGELVTLEAVKITDLHQADNYGTTEFTAVSNDGASTVVRLDNRTGTVFDDFPYQNGDMVSITGISSQFKDTYQLKPRSIKDFASIDIDWIKDYVNKSNIHPKGIKNAIQSKLDASKKNPKHLPKLIDFIQHQPTKHIPNDVKEALIHFIQAILP
ncbi:DUF5689 domain-containing protein [Virgibacillus halophilus]|uniref:DUF5689 domain-containing protein n=1 Tax=Tigheibacillus halophilus TaxID=361280 RepID=A0ABU5C729_9BACI|nr:DUF5689 domain-containing protein [Virgibacillus halophilus]